MSLLIGSSNNGDSKWWLCGDYVWAKIYCVTACAFICWVTNVIVCLFWYRWPKAPYPTLTHTLICPVLLLFSVLSLLFVLIITITYQFLIHVGITLLRLDLPRSSVSSFSWLCFLDADFCLFLNPLWSGAPGWWWDSVPRARPLSQSISRSLSLTLSHTHSHLLGGRAVGAMTKPRLAMC